MIKAIIFDYNRVIEMMDKGLIDSIADYLKISKKDWQKIYFTFNHLCNLGKNTYEEVYGLVAKKLGAGNEQVAHIHNLMKQNRLTTRLNKELVEMIKDLKKKNYSIGLLSNNYSKLKQELDDFGITELFDAIVVSAVVGYQKPQPEIFEIIFKELGVKSSEAIFIDNAPASLAGAENIGYIPILYTDNEQLKKELRKNNIKI